MSTDRIKRLNTTVEVSVSENLSDPVDKMAEAFSKKIIKLKDGWLERNYTRITGKSVPEDCTEETFREWRIIETRIPNGGSQMDLYHLESPISCIIINLTYTTLYYTIEDNDGTRDSGYINYKALDESY